MPISPDGQIVTSEDAAHYLGVEHGQMIYWLYRAPDAQRYRAFEIPKRSGGMRQIHAPSGLIREMQEKLAPILQERYDAHPGAHGFIKERSILTNAKAHVGQRLVLNVDLADFFPSINFGRVRGLFMAAPFGLGAGAATVFAQLCTHRNGLPQGAPTSPVLSNFIATSLDRRLTRLAKDNGVRYSRYADDITFSTNNKSFPPAIAHFEQGAHGLVVQAGEALSRAIEASGFAINPRKVRIQRHSQRQTVTGLSVNSQVNVQRTRIRRVRAMLHAWEKFGLEDAGRAHFTEHRGARKLPNNPGRAFRNIVYGELSFIKMVRGQEDAVFLKLCAKLIPLDPNPSRFIRQMVFGAGDFDVFISHASEDKEKVARPIFAACEQLGLKAFMDEAHIGWGQSFTEKINTALGSARTVLAIVSSNSVAKDWPVAEVNAALNFEVTGQKKVVPLLVGKPDLSRLPLLQSKDSMNWSGDAMAVARRLKAAKEGDAPRSPSARTVVPVTDRAPSWPAGPAAKAKPPKRKRSLFEWLFGRQEKR